MIISATIDLMFTLVSIAVYAAVGGIIIGSGLWAHSILKRNDLV